MLTKCWLTYLQQRSTIEPVIYLHLSVVWSDFIRQLYVAICCTKGNEYIKIPAKATYRNAVNRINEKSALC